MNVKDYCDKKGRYPLHQCVLHENKELMQKLINAGADITCQDKKGRTPLHYACKMNSFDMCEFLLNLGASVDLPDFYGRTPMHEASARGFDLLVQLFYEYGANPFATDNKDVNFYFF